MAHNSAFGYATNQSSKKTATELALKFCESRKKRVAAQHSWAKLNKNEGCRVVEVAGPLAVRVKATAPMSVGCVSYREPNIVFHLSIKKQEFSCARRV